MTAKDAVINVSKSVPFRHVVVSSLFPFDVRRNEVEVELHGQQVGEVLAVSPTMFDALQKELEGRGMLFVGSAGSGKTVKL